MHEVVYTEDNVTVLYMGVGLYTRLSFDVARIGLS